jgi:plasmid stabilization system protein ParE
MEMIVLWTDSAIEDLQNIFNYYQNNSSRNVVIKIGNSIIEATLNLSKNPKIGRKEDLLPNKKEELRFIIDGNYKILYFIENNFIFVLTIFDCRQNPKKLEKK